MDITDKFIESVVERLNFGDPDDEILSAEESCAVEIINQIKNGGNRISDSEDLLRELVDHKFNSSVDFEFDEDEVQTLYLGIDQEDQFDEFTTRLLSIFKEKVGVTLDTSSETLAFSDLYNVYIVFVSDIRNVAEAAFIGSMDERKDTIENLLLSEEYLYNDSFMEDARAGDPGNSYIEEVAILQDHYLIHIDKVIFEQYLTNVLVGDDSDE